MVAAASANRALWLWESAAAPCYCPRGAARVGVRIIPRLGSELAGALVCTPSPYHALRSGVCGGRSRRYTGQCASVRNPRGADGLLGAARLTRVHGGDAAHLRSKKKKAAPRSYTVAHAFHSPTARSRRGPPARPSTRLYGGDRAAAIANHRLQAVADPFGDSRHERSSAISEGTPSDSGWSLASA